MRVVQVPAPGAPFELVERPTPEPGAREVRIKLEACGICHSDSFTVQGAWPGINYPRVPGHEIAGRIDAIGPGVTTWKVGRRVGVVLVRRQLWRMPRVPEGRFHSLRRAEGPRHQL